MRYDRLMRHQRLLPLFTGLLVAALLISNTVGGKLFELGPFTLSAATLIFPLSYLLGDILTEVYGYAASRKVVWTGFGALVLMTACYQFAAWVAPSPATVHPEAYAHIFSQTPRLVFASVLAYLVGEFMNSYVVARMKVLQEGRWMAARFVASTVIGEFFDSIIVIIVAFAGTLPWEVLFKIILSIWFFKVAWEVIALPVTLPLVRAVKRFEQEDHYDRHTNFSPFKFD